MSGYIDTFGAPACSRLPLAAALVFFLTLTHLHAKSVIVQDTETDKIIYSPKGWEVGWQAGSNVTWHDGRSNDSTAPVFFTFTFTGTSVEVIYDKHNPVNVSYSIDSVQRTTMGLPASDGNPYGQTLLREGGLANVQHTLRVEISSRPSNLVVTSIIYDDGSAVPSSVSSVSSTPHSTSPTDSQIITSVPSGSSPNIGAIVGGVVAGVVVSVALFWYLRRRRQQTSQRGIFQFFRSRPEANANAPPPGAQTQELPRSHYYAPSGVTSSSSPTTRAFAPQQSPSIQTGTYTPAAEPSPTGAFHTGTNSIPFTTPSGPSTTTKPGDIPSDPIVDRGSGAHVPGMAPSHAQGSATAGPPSSAFNVAVNRVQGQIPNEPVEEGLMSGGRRGRYR